ncbi:MAG: L-fucose:H+ symporter permease [Kiritimatiellae bacterium]|nr:L-fucose:H+ symporter permease [Kiritimatiellia bacterium]MDD5519885.1 L-fucose:H+ symporter permease [Kiritimatiellia bacterium]
MSTEKKSMFVTDDGRNVVVTFILVSSLFLLWGFCNGMIDVMDKHFQTELKLSLAQSAWVQFAHYLGYFLMAIPAGWLATKLGYKGGIIAGLLMVAVGGFWFIPATKIASFWAFLLGVCVIAAGLTFLETIANPYTTVLGDKRYAATRINLAQSCNGIGWIFGPIAGAAFFYGKDSSGQSTGSATLWIPYAAVGVVVLVLAIIFYFANVPDIKTEDTYHLDDSAPNVSHSIWTHPHFVLAVIAQFLYVAAQAGIFSFFINYMTSQVPPLPESWTSGFLKSWLEPGTAGGAVRLTDQGAAKLASVGFVCFLIGRFSGAAILRTFSAHKVLGLYGLMNVMACLLVFLKLGWISVVCVFLSYFFMSIMFPTIFALGIYGLGARAKKASSYIVMAIMGGAILPKLMGHVGDLYDMSRAFIVPLGCFAFVSFYGYFWPKFSKAESMHVDPTRGGH